MCCDDKSFSCIRVECGDDVLAIDDLPVVDTGLEILDINGVAIIVERRNHPISTLLMRHSSRHTRPEITLRFHKIIRRITDKLRNGYMFLRCRLRLLLWLLAVIIARNECDHNP